MVNKIWKKLAVRRAVYTIIAAVGLAYGVPVYIANMAVIETVGEAVTEHVQKVDQVAD